MLIVHHQVTGRQRQRVDDVAPLGRQPLALGGADPAAGQIGLGDDDQVGAGNDDAVTQRALEHPDDSRLGRLAGIEHPRGVSDSDSRSTTRCAVPVPGATSAAYPPVAMWARSIAKISSMSRWCPRADGAANVNSIADSSDNWLNVHHG